MLLQPWTIFTWRYAVCTQKILHNIENATSIPKHWLMGTCWAPYGSLIERVKEREKKNCSEVRKLVKVLKCEQTETQWPGCVEEMWELRQEGGRRLQFCIPCPKYNYFCIYCLYYFLHSFFLMPIKLYQSAHSLIEIQGESRQAREKKHGMFMFYSHSKYTIDVSLYYSWSILNISLSTSQLTLSDGNVIVCVWGGAYACMHPQTHPF